MESSSESWDDESSEESLASDVSSEQSDGDSGESEESDLSSDVSDASDTSELSDLSSELSESSVSSSSSFCEVELKLDPAVVCCGDFIEGTVAVHSNRPRDVEVFPPVEVVGLLPMGGFSFRYSPTEDECGAKIVFTAFSDCEPQSATGIVAHIVAEATESDEYGNPYVLGLGQQRTLQFWIVPSDVGVRAVIDHFPEGEGRMTYADGSLEKVIQGSGTLTVLGTQVSSLVGDSFIRFYISEQRWCKTVGFSIARITTSPQI